MSYEFWLCAKKFSFVCCFHRCVFHQLRVFFIRFVCCQSTYVSQPSLNHLEYLLSALYRYLIRINVFRPHPSFVLKTEWTEVEKSNMNGKMPNSWSYPMVGVGGDRKPYGADRKPMTNNKPKSQQQNGSTLRPVDWTNVTLTPIRKNFFQPTLVQSKEVVDEFLKTNEITLRGTELPPPTIEFYDGLFPDYVMQSVQRQGFQKPTAIQATSWPIALSGRDLVGIARTGSGKTLVCWSMTNIYLL